MVNNGTKFLNVVNFHVRYFTDDETIYAVNGVNFSMNSGDTLGIVGETGAGKTTIALGILRLLPRGTGFITEGSIEFEGEDITKIQESKMRVIRGGRISMIFQDPMTSLNPVLPVGKQIDEVLRHHTSLTESEIDARVDEMLRMVGIDPRRKKNYPHQFSGGMKQRVVIAMALACRPALLIADEPTTALDVTIQAQVLNMMAALKDELGTAMILITHDLGIVAEVCNKVAIMYAGEFIEYGSVEHIFDETRPHHPYTAGLFGSIPDLEKRTPRLTPIEGHMPNPSDLPSGCKFHPRCLHVMGECHEGVIHEWGSCGHRIKCQLFREGPF
jgi:peptide/nickel transport system ATP-binding protein